jgi:hypothetical protein
VFGIVTKRQLEQHVEELRREFERADFVAKEWYAKFRALYARLSRKVSTGDEEAVDGAPGASPPVLPSHPEQLERRRRMRGF